MAYLGREIQYGSFAKQTLTANSSTTVFTLSNGVADANNLLVSIGGIIQEPNVAYTAIGTVLTFASAPVTDDPIFVTFLGMETSSAGAGRSDVTFQKGTGNGSATPLTLSTSVLNADAIRVSLNGVVQKPWTDFTASGTTLTFTTAPDATNEILVYYVGKEASLTDVATGSVTAAKLSSSGTLPAWDGSNISNISVIPYSKLNDLNHNLALIGFRRSTDHGTSSLDLPNGFIDQFEDQTNVNDDNSVGETWATGTEAATVTTGQAPANFGTSNANLPSSTGTNAAMRFQTTTTDPITAISVGLHNQKNRDVTIQIVTGSATVPDVDTLVATGATSTLVAASLVINVYNKFTLDKPFTPVVGTNYWIQITAGSGSGDTRLQEGNASQYTWAYAGLWTTTSGHNSNSIIPVEVHQTPNLDYYTNNGDVTTIPSSASDWSGATSSATFSSGSVVYTAPNVAIRSSAQLTGDFEFESTIGTSASGQGHWAGVFLVSQVGTFSSSQELGSMHQMSGAYFFAKVSRAGQTAGFSARNISGGENVTAFSSATGDILKIKRVGTTITVYLNGVLKTTENGQPSAAMYACVGGGGGGGSVSSYTSVSWKVAGIANNMTLVSESDTAAASTDKAYVTLFNQPVDSVTLNTDFMAWASRSSKTVTATNATNLLTANGHGLSNNDRVILTTSASDLPNGLTETAYYVVSSTTNTFQVAATSGGAAITFSDDGTGTHTVHAVTPVTLADKGDYGTGKEILAGTADISGQPTGTDMRLIVQTKNNKETKLHGMALQYS